MGTYRESRERKAERLREWADKRETKAAESFETASKMADAIPFGQPILVGHYSEGRDRRYRARIEANGFKGVEHSRKAEEMASRADGIESQLANSIYSDDDDAIPRLREKLEALEGERERIKAYNASCRKAAKTGGSGDLELLNERERKSLLSTARAVPAFLGKHGEMPAYHLKNLAGNIKRTRDRIAQLERGPVERPPRPNKYAGTCELCGEKVDAGAGLLKGSRGAWITEHLPNECVATACRHCGQTVEADSRGTLVDATGGDVCGQWGTFNNEPHEIPKHLPNTCEGGETNG